MPIDAVQFHPKQKEGTSQSGSAWLLQNNKSIVRRWDVSVLFTWNTFFSGFSKITKTQYHSNTTKILLGKEVKQNRELYCTLHSTKKTFSKAIYTKYKIFKGLSLCVLCFQENKTLINSSVAMAVKGTVPPKNENLATIYIYFFSLPR